MTSAHHFYGDGLMLLGVLLRGGLLGFQLSDVDPPRALFVTALGMAFAVAVLFPVGTD